MTTNTTINAERIVELSARDGNTVFHHGIHTEEHLAWLGIHDLHDAYKWYNDHVRRVPHNAIRILRVAQSIWPHAMTWCRNAHVAVHQDGMGRSPMNYKYSAINSKTGRMKLLPKLRRSPISTNAYARFLRNNINAGSDRANCHSCGRINGGRPEFGGMCERCIST